MDDEYRRTVESLLLEMKIEEEKQAKKEAEAAATKTKVAEQFQLETQALARRHLKKVGKSVERGKKAQERSKRRAELLQQSLKANISAGVHVWVDPAGISGLWRAFGATTDGSKAEEFLQLRVAADGTVTGMVDSDGDGVWSEEDCRVANGFFDGATCSIRFDQVYDDHPTEEDRLAGFDKTRWEAVYEPSSNRFVKGHWSTAGGSAGTFECERTTEEAMRNRNNQR
jgi:hypothetical protein